MKNLIVIVISFFALSSCKLNQVMVVVANPSEIVHHKTTVEIAWADITAKLPSVDPEKMMVVNAANGEELMHQIIYNGQPSPQMLIFQVTLAAKESIKFLIKEGVAVKQPVKVYGRFIPERKDDFAWENDRIAFRMYGPALAKENPGNGVDIWLKRTDKMIVDQFYKDDLENGKSYHVDHGYGLDCYKVGHALGAGGIAPYLNDTLWVGNHYTTHKILDNGPIRVSFLLTYDNLPVGKKILNQEINISLDAGSQLNKAVVSYNGGITNMQVAGGISLHQETGKIKSDATVGYIAYAETAVSDAGVSAGRSYIAVVIPGGMTESIKKSGHLLALSPYREGDKFTYYFGGGWSNWGFGTDEEWFNYVSSFTASLKSPLKVTIR